MLLLIAAGLSRRGLVGLHTETLHWTEDGLRAEGRRPAQGRAVSSSDVQFATSPFVSGSFYGVADAYL